MLPDSYTIPPYSLFEVYLEFLTSIEWRVAEEIALETVKSPALSLKTTVKAVGKL